MADAPPGAFTDFAIQAGNGSSLLDPAMSHVTNVILRDPTFTPVPLPTDWVRLSITATAPNSFPGVTDRYTYRRAAFARVHLTADGAALNEIHQFAYAQFEHSPPGVTVDDEQIGQNLLDIEQGSYEGRVFYEPTSTRNTPAYTTPEPQATFQRATDNVYCGEYSGKFTYQYTPDTDNTYAEVRKFSTYGNIRARRSTYAAVRFRAYTAADALPISGSTLPAPLLAALADPPDLNFALLPMFGAFVAVQPAIVYRAQVVVATERPNLGIYCQVNFYDSNRVLLDQKIATPLHDQSPVTPGRVTSVGARRWQVVGGMVKAPANAAYAAVVPRITTIPAGTERLVFWCDEHRLLQPAVEATRAAGVSSARPWQAARQLTIKLRATRVNYVTNPQFHANTVGYEPNPVVAPDPPPLLAATITRRTADGLNKGPCAQYTVTGPGGAAVAIDILTSSQEYVRTGIGSVLAPPALVDRLKPDTKYTASVYVQPTSTPVPLTIWANNGADWIRGETSNPYAPEDAAPWDRIRVTFTTRSTFSGTCHLIVGYAPNSVAYLFGPIVPGTDNFVWQQTDAATPTNWDPATRYNVIAGQPKPVVKYAGFFWQAQVDNGPAGTTPKLEFRMDQFLLEEGGNLQDYFDGSNPTSDYMWEGAVGNSRSHYYRGRSRNQYRLQRALDTHIPLGGSYRILYASAP